MPPPPNRSWLQACPWLTKSYCGVVWYRSGIFFLYILTFACWPDLPVMYGFLLSLTPALHKLVVAYLWMTLIVLDAIWSNPTMHFICDTIMWFVYKTGLFGLVICISVSLELAHFRVTSRGGGGGSASEHVELVQFLVTSLGEGESACTCLSTPVTLLGGGRLLAQGVAVD